MKDGEYLTFDYAAYIPNEGFLIFAESEFDNNSNESLQGDFEKLLYVRSACKVMMAWVSDSVHAERVAADLSKYARSVCREFSAGEVYVLYFSNWGSDMEEAVYYWQAPGDVNSCRAMNFQFDALSAMDA